MAPFPRPVRGANIGSADVPDPRAGASAGEHRQPVARRLGGLLWHWGPVLAWVGVILCLSSQPDLRSAAPAPVAESQSVFFAVSKVAHVVEYSTLGLLFLRALAGRGGGLSLPLGVAVVLSVLASGLFGTLDEVRQSFVPNRTPRLADIALDTASALIATTLAAGLVRLRHPRPPASTQPHVQAPPLPRAGDDVGARPRENRPADDIAGPERACESKDTRAAQRAGG